MTSSFATPLHFAVHLLAVFVALGLALTFSREPEGGASRLAIVAGFVTLAVAESIHGGAFAGDLGPLPVVLRSLAYVLIMASAVLWRPAELAAVAFVAGRAIGPAAAAALAAGATLWRRKDQRLPIGGGVALLAASEALLGGDASWSDTAAHTVRAAGFLLLGSYALQAARRSIQFRFMAGFISVLLIVVLVISVAVSQVIDRNVREAALERLRAVAGDMNNNLQEEAQKQSVSLVALVESSLATDANTPTLSAEDAADLKVKLLPSVDFIIFLDEARREIGREGIQAGPATEVAGTPVVTECLEEQVEVSSLTTLGERKLALIGCSAVEHRGELAGAGIAGFEFNSQLLAQIAPPGTEAAVFRRGDPRPVAVNGPFPGTAPGSAFLPAARLELLLERFAVGESSEEAELRVGSEGYFVSFAPLKRSNGQIEAVLMVVERADVVGETTQAVIRLIFLVTLGVIIIALLLALVAARRITRPVVALTRAAREVQRGNLSAKAAVGGEDEVGDLARAFNQMTDSVTEATGRLRAAAEEEARLRDRMETVLNSMGDGLIAVGQDGKITTYNPAAASIVGRAEDDVVGRPIDQVLRGRDAEDLPISLDGEMPPGTVLLQHAGGGDTPVAITSSQLRDAQGILLGRVYVLRDMSREHEVERMKTEFLSNVSHELRTPLTPIIGYSEIMTRRGVAPERGQEFAGAILDSARRLERIVAMLVDFSAMEGGRMTIDAQPASIRKLVKGAVDTWRDRSEQHRFVTKFTQGLPEAMVDSSLLRRALDELLDNAVKYSPNGGNIRVSVSSPNSRSQRILKVDVEDEGIGIEEGDLATIFEDFHQVDASDTRTYGGLGLGLAFVRRIVEAHRGDISAESQPGTGTTFSFTLPLADKDGEKP